MRCRGGRAARRCGICRRTRDFLLEQWRQDAFGDYYRNSAIYGRGFYDRFPDAPSLHMGSWYDPYVRSTIENFTALRGLKSAPAYLVMGPWTHGTGARRTPATWTSGPRATLDGNLAPSYLEFRRRWFDRGPRTARRCGAVTSRDPVLPHGRRRRAARRGRADAARWRVAHGHQWPPTSTERAALYLGADGRAQPPPRPRRAAPR